MRNPIHLAHRLAPIFSALAAAARPAVTSAAPTTQPWRTPDPAAVARWRDMRFGMFIHWGPVSQTGREISWSRGTSTPVETYDALYKTFDPTQFNADAWVSVAKSAGMKYVVLTCKHHDGFCLFDSKLTVYKITNTPFKRDVTRELADACRRQGIAFGAYYSVCDWHNPDFPLTSPGGKAKRPTSDIEAYNQYLLGQVRELLTNYGPLITIWNDVPQQFKGRGVREIEMARTIQPDILINNRTGDGGDYLTPEQKVGAYDDAKPWESCMTISAHNHWAWGGAKDGVKPLKAIVDMLVDCAGRDGNMMLNVGPEPTGVINADQAGAAAGNGPMVGRRTASRSTPPVAARGSRRRPPSPPAGATPSTSTSRRWPGERRSRSRHWVVTIHVQPACWAAAVVQRRPAGQGPAGHDRRRPGRSV